jgi:hypothetical protein
MPGSVNYTMYQSVLWLCNDDVMILLILQIFGYDSSFRIALMIPNDKLNIACNRISEFCNKHYRK